MIKPQTWKEYDFKCDDIHKNKDEIWIAQNLRSQKQPENAVKDRMKTASKLKMTSLWRLPTLVSILIQISSLSTVTFVIHLLHDSTESN